MKNYRHATAGINPHFEKELTLMLDGKKPLAWFNSSMHHDTVWPPGRVWDYYVDQGQFIREEREHIYKGREEKDIFFALSDEAWRIDKLKELIDSPDYLDAEIGKLLGYTDEEIDEFLKHFSIGLHNDDEKYHWPEEFHTNNELAWMLAGKKPLTLITDAFEQYQGSSPIVEDEYLDFKPYVEEGRFTMKEVFTHDVESPFITHTIYVTYPGEEWRGEELYEMSLNCYEKFKTNPALYTMRTGELLGYSDPSNLDHVRGWQHITEDDVQAALKILPSLRREGERRVTERQTLEA